MAEKSRYTVFLDDLQNRLKPTLIQHGFKKKGRLFQRESQDIFHLIDFQTSMWNDANEGRFTINLVGVNEKVTRVMFKKEPPKNLRMWFPVFDQRIGWFLPSKSDFWWSVKSDTSLDLLEAEFLGVVIPVIIDHFEKMRNLSSLLEGFETGSIKPQLLPMGIVKGLIQVGMGKYYDAIEALQKEIDESKHDGFRKYYSEVIEEIKYLQEK